MNEQGGSLYNRHRPASFADLVGQSHVERALGNALRASRPLVGSASSRSAPSSSATLSILRSASKIPPQLEESLLHIADGGFDICGFL